MPASPLAIGGDVAAALASRTPVVALESAVLTHGLPKDDAIEAIRRQREACAAQGAVVAVVGVFDGQLRVGLSQQECEALAAHPQPAKVSIWNLAAALARPGYGGTTVAATVLAAARAGVRVVSTGGMGGVHRQDFDVSADLTELARHPECLICAGPKSFLDLRRTLERMETLGIPVIGWRSSTLAGFYASDAGLPVPARADTVGEIAGLLRAHWALGGAGVVVSQPLPAEAAIPRADLESVDAEPIGLPAGSAASPAELARLRHRLGVRAVTANLLLLEQNASLAARLAAELAQ